jgi:hypothetical protein
MDLNVRLTVVLVLMELQPQGQAVLQTMLRFAQAAIKDSILVV